jgi:alkylation response protein AidB-like acyl-CoA dehydrogenase
VERETLKTLDPTRGAAKLTFSGAPVRRLGDAGDGIALMEAVFDRAAVLLAFEQVGGADRCLEMAKEYALGATRSAAPSPGIRPSSTSSPTCT